MNKKLIFCILIGIFTAVPAIAQDIWRCPGGAYTTSPSSHKNCEPVDASTLCSSGGKRYITPSNKHFENLDQLCGDNSRTKKNSVPREESTSKGTVSCFFRSLLQRKINFNCDNQS